MTKKEITKYIDDSLEFSRGLLDASGSYADAFGSLEKSFEILREKVNEKTTTSDLDKEIIKGLIWRGHIGFLTYGKNWEEAIKEVKQRRCDFWDVYKNEIEELETAKEVLLNSQELIFSTWPMCLISWRLDSIFDKFPFILSDEEIKRHAEKMNVARIYELDDFGRIFETIPKLNFMKRYLSPYAVYKIEKNYFDTHEDDFRNG